MKADSCQPEILIFNPGIFFVNASQRQAAAPKTRTSFSWGALFFVPALVTGIYFVNTSQAEPGRNSRP